MTGDFFLLMGEGGKLDGEARLRIYGSLTYLPYLVIESACGELAVEGYGSRAGMLDCEMRDVLTRFRVLIVVPLSKLYIYNIRQYWT